MNQMGTRKNPGMMKITVSPDTMGNLIGYPVSERIARRLKKYYGGTNAFAQADSQLYHDILGGISKQAASDVDDGYDANTIVPVEWYENWLSISYPV
jgi:hypothetical protein